MIKIDNKKIDPYRIYQMYDKKVVFEYTNGLYFYENGKTFEIVVSGLHSVVENTVDRFYSKNLYYVCLHESALLFNIYDLEEKTNNIVCKLDLNILKEPSEFTEIKFRYITKDYLLLSLYGNYKILDLKNGQILQLSEINKFTISYVNIILHKNNINLIANCIYNRLDNSIEYIKGTIAPISFGSKELVFVKE